MALEDLEPQLPRFTGANPNSWICQSELYFQFYSIYGDERFSYVIEVFEDGPFYWFNSWFRSDDLTWNDFTTAMLHQFCSSSLTPTIDTVVNFSPPLFALQVFDEMPDGISNVIDYANDKAIDDKVLDIEIIDYNLPSEPDPLIAPPIPTGLIPVFTSALMLPLDSISTIGNMETNIRTSKDYIQMFVMTTPVVPQASPKPSKSGSYATLFVGLDTNFDTPLQWIDFGFDPGPIMVHQPSLIGIIQPVDLQVELMTHTSTTKCSLPSTTFYSKCSGVVSFFMLDGGPTIAATHSILAVVAISEEGCHDILLSQSVFQVLSLDVARFGCRSTGWFDKLPKVHYNQISNYNSPPDTDPLVAPLTRSYTSAAHVKVYQKHMSIVPLVHPHHYIIILTFGCLFFLGVEPCIIIILVDDSKVNDMREPKECDVSDSMVISSFDWTPGWIENKVQGPEHCFIHGLFSVTHFPYLHKAAEMSTLLSETICESLTSFLASTTVVTAHALQNFKPPIWAFWAPQLATIFVQSNETHIHVQVVMGVTKLSTNSEVRKFQMGNKLLGWKGDTTHAFNTIHQQVYGIMRPLVSYYVTHYDNKFTVASHVLMSTQTVHFTPLDSLESFSQTTYLDSLMANQLQLEEAKSLVMDADPPQLLWLLDWQQPNHSTHTEAPWHCFDIHIMHTWQFCRALLVVTTFENLLSLKKKTLLNVASRCVLVNIVLLEQLNVASRCVLVNIVLLEQVSNGVGPLSVIHNMGDLLTQLLVVNYLLLICSQIGLAEWWFYHKTNLKVLIMEQCNQWTPSVHRIDNLRILEIIFYTYAAEYKIFSIRYHSQNLWRFLFAHIKHIVASFLKHESLKWSAQGGGMVNSHFYGLWALYVRVWNLVQPKGKVCLGLPIIGLITSVGCHRIQVFGSMISWLSRMNTVWFCNNEVVHYKLYGLEDKGWTQTRFVGSDFNHYLGFYTTRCVLGQKSFYLYKFYMGLGCEVYKYHGACMGWGVSRTWVLYFWHNQSVVRHEHVEYSRMFKPLHLEDKVNLKGGSNVMNRTSRPILVSPVKKPNKLN
ncbi:hypothetical protein HanIR_Chr15g0785601 [Helianthus annuus]|nr:hypothetical protein HanIR_Chr15g0785601 [Helianthus annuus]